jgi:uncharacterized membrane protein
MGAMISVVATVVFFILLLHAFLNSKPVTTSGYATKSFIIIPKALVEKRGFNITKSLAGFLSMISYDTLLGIPEHNQLSFQLPASPIMEGIIDLHHDIMFILVFISIFVLYMLVTIVVLFGERDNDTRNTSAVSHHTTLEII